MPASSPPLPPSFPPTWGSTRLSKSLQIKIQHPKRKNATQIDLIPLDYWRFVRTEALARHWEALARLWEAQLVLGSSFKHRFLLGSLNALFLHVYLVTDALDRNQWTEAFVVLQLLKRETANGDANGAVAGPRADGAVCAPTAREGRRGGDGRGHLGRGIAVPLREFVDDAAVLGAVEHLYRSFLRHISAYLSLSLHVTCTVERTPRAPLTQFCAPETSERMAIAAWKQARDILRQENEQDDPLHAHALRNTLDRFKLSMGVACTAALVTNYEKKGLHQCFFSVCKADVAQQGNGDDGGGHGKILQQHCETYHLNLSKTLKRTRNEEDRIVSHWLVYLLAKSANVDPDATNALHEALLAEQHAEDTFTIVTSGHHASGVAPINTPLQEICAGSVSELTSVAFLPPMPGDDTLASAVVKDLGFRGVVLSGSFNPLHQGHVDLARAAQRLIQDRSGIELPIAFEIAVSNADKGAIAPSTVMQRVQQFGCGSATTTASSPLGVWPVLVTNATLFSEKASLLKSCAFVIGADTAVRIVDKKYYDMDEHKMVLTLQQIARNDCFFVVAGRFDDKSANRYISADEVLQSSIPKVFKELFVPLDESVFRSDLSSTQLRNRVQQHQK